MSGVFLIISRLYSDLKNTFSTFVNLICSKIIVTYRETNCLIFWDSSIEMTALFIFTYYVSEDANYINSVVFLTILSFQKGVPGIKIRIGFIVYFTSKGTVPCLHKFHDSLLNQFWSQLAINTCLMKQIIMPSN